MIQQSKSPVPSLELRRRFLDMSDLWPSSNGHSPTTMNVLLPLGGQSEAAEMLPKISRDLADRCLKVDLDHTSASGSIPSIVLTTDGEADAILKCSDRYSYLRGDALPPDWKAWETYLGAGQRRAAATVSLGFAKDRIDSELRSFCLRVLKGFKGPLQKRVVLHVIFSLAGGTGSSLGIPLALLAMDKLRWISRLTQVDLVAHCIGANVFAELVGTPAERNQTLGNMAVTLREMLLVQDPAESLEIASALDIAPIMRPLFNRVLVYDVADSGGGVQSLEQIRSAIVANIVGSDNTVLSGVEASRDVNHLRTGERSQAELGPRVVESQSTWIVRVDVAKLSKLHAAQTVVLRLSRLLQPSDSETVLATVQRVVGQLELNSALRDLYEQLRPDSSYHLSADLARLPDMIFKARGDDMFARWTNRGQAETQERGRWLSSQLRESAPRLIAGSLETVTAAIHSLSGYREAIIALLETLDQRIAEVNGQLEELAAANPRQAYRVARERLDQASILVARRHRAKVLRALQGVIDSEVREEALRVYRDCWLGPMRAYLLRELDRASDIERELAVGQQQLELQVESLRGSVGFTTHYFRDAITFDELPAIMRQLSSDVGDLPKLALASVLGAKGAKDRQSVLASLTAETCRRTLDFIARKAKHLPGFIEYFGLRFDLHDWVREASQFTLPAKLSAARVNPGNAPQRTYIVADESLAGLTEMFKRDGFTREFRATDDPFSIIVSSKVSGMTFGSIPGLSDAERQYQSLADAERQQLLSHMALKRALDLEL